MADRRRSPRYLFYAPVDAQAEAVYEAVVEGVDGDRAVVMTTHAAARGDDVVIRFSSLTKELTTYAARVVSCTPAAGGDGMMHFRLILSLSESSPSRGAGLVAGHLSQSGVKVEH